MDTITYNVVEVRIFESNFEHPNYLGIESDDLDDVKKQLHQYINDNPAKDGIVGDRKYKIRYEIVSSIDDLEDPTPVYVLNV